MSRVTEIMQLVKRDLLDYNVRNVNSAEIFHALYEGQKHLAIAEDCIEIKVEIILVEDQAEYNFAYNGGGEDDVDLFIIKRVKSLQQPGTWPELSFPVDEEFDKLKSYDASTSITEFAIIRNNKIEFYAPPGSADDGEKVTLQVFLKAPTLKPDDTNEIQTPIEFDQALRYFCLWFYLPLTSKDKSIAWNEMEREISRKSGVFNNRMNKVRSPKCNW